MRPSPRPDYLLSLARAGLLWPGSQHEDRRRPVRRFRLPDWHAWTWHAPSDPWEVYREISACSRLALDLEGHRLPWGYVEAGQLFEVRQYGRALPVPRVVAMAVCPVMGRRWVLGEPGGGVAAC